MRYRADISQLVSVENLLTMGDQEAPSLSASHMVQMPEGGKQDSTAGSNPSSHDESNPFETVRDSMSPEWYGASLESSGEPQRLYDLRGKPIDDQQRPQVSGEIGTHDRLTNTRLRSVCYDYI